MAERGILTGEAKRVLLVSDLTGGGAGVVCGRLYRGLSAAGAVRWIAAVGDAESGAAIAAERPAGAAGALWRMIRRWRPGGRLDWRGEGLCHERNVRECVAESKPDLINLHNIHQRMTFSLLVRLPHTPPIVWTLHDMWALTGYCKHSYECRKFLDGCRGECPQWGRQGLAWRQPANEWRRRQRFYSANARRLTFVCPSRWLAEQARERVGPAVKVVHAPNPLDLRVFRPLGNREHLRSVLELPQDRRIVLAVCHRLDDASKGVHVLKEAILRMGSRGRCDPIVVELGSAGGMRPTGPGWLWRGTIRDEALLNIYYNAADVFVAPSSADNLPNTLVEATAAGTPCVTFDVGGCPEVVRHGETGFVAKPGDVEDLAASIERVLSMPATDLAQMRRRCREHAEREFALERQAARYRQIFEEALHGRAEV